MLKSRVVDKRSLLTMNSGMPPHHQNHHHSQQQQSRNGDYFGLSHDPMTAINNFDHDRHQSSLSNLPIPVGKYNP